MLILRTDIMKALSKSLAGQASMMFSSRDHENLQRARHLRRMSFSIWSGTVDQYSSTLPTIQEKLVESLKIPHAPVLRILFLLIHSSSLFSILISYPPRLHHIYSSILMHACAPTAHCTCKLTWVLACDPHGDDGHLYTRGGRSCAYYSCL